MGLLASNSSLILYCCLSWLISSSQGLTKLDPTKIPHSKKKKPIKIQQQHGIEKLRISEIGGLVVEDWGFPPNYVLLT